MTGPKGLDLDAYHAEHAGTGHQVTVGGKRYTLPSHVPILLPEYLREGRVLDALRLLFGDDAETVGPLFYIDEDGGSFAPILALYGLNVPEASASPAS